MNLDNASTLVFPPFEREELSNGLTVYWVSDFEQATVTVALQLPFGRFSDMRGQEGCTELMVALVQKGTTNLTHEAFSDRFERTGSSLFSDVAEEHAIIGCRMLERHSDAIVPLFWEMVTAPGLDDRELRIIKRELLTSMQAELSDPGALAHHHFAALLMGRDHVAGRNRTPESVKSISQQMAHRQYNTCFSPQGGALVVAGAVGTAQARERWRTLFESWQEGDIAHPLSVESPVMPGGGNVVVVDKPDLTQTTLLVGHLMPGELGSERNHLALANYVFGGGNFSSRLMNRVRSRLGKTYGISSQYVTTGSMGLFTISTATRNEQAAQMLEMILDEYRQLHENGITADELQKAQQYTSGSMAFQLEGIGNIAERLLWLHLYNRPVEYLEQFAQTIGSLTLNNVNSAVRRHCSHSGCAIVAVGAAAVLGVSLEPFGKVQVVSHRTAPGSY